MTPRQKKFCYEYANSGNATLSAINAGYAEKTARSQGQRLLTLSSVQKMLKDLAEEYASAKIATASEMQEKLTEIIRGQFMEDVIAVEGCGDGVSQAVTVQKKPSARDVRQAIETLARMQGLFHDNNVLNVFVPVFSGEDDLEE
ncbi:MAG: terminase small subunit [Clostridia bacterium]|nr:terminase small subunit [Clostridia bacterium]